jgi:hypothetical protein
VLYQLSPILECPNTNSISLNLFKYASGRFPARVFIPPPQISQNPPSSRIHPALCFRDLLFHLFVLGVSFARVGREGIKAQGFDF